MATSQSKKNAARTATKTAASGTRVRAREREVAPASDATPSPLAALEARIAALEATQAQQTKKLESAARLTAIIRDAIRTANNPSPPAPLPEGEGSVVPKPARANLGPTLADDRFWALNELNRQHAAAPDDRGAVLYSGTVALPSGAQYAWQRQDSTRVLLEQNWHDLAENIAALGHPVRLSILKHALGQDRSTQDFMSLPDMGTTGQLFHHIKALQDTGWLRSLQRGLYGVPGERVIPLLAILAAARG